MVKKTGKILICIFVVLLLFLQNSSIVLARITNHTAGTTGTFGIEQLHESSYLDGSGTQNMGYRVDGKNAYRIYYGNKDYESTILCLDKNGRFPHVTDAGGNTNQGNYTSLGESTAENLKTAKASIDADGATRINWLLSNAVLPEDSTEMQKQKISEIFNDIINSTKNDINPVTPNQIRSVLTQDDIVFALQLAVWNITNNNVPGTIQGTYDGNFFDSLTGNNIFSYKGVRGAYIKHMYNYYVEHWNQNPSSTGTNPVVSKPEQDNTTQALDYIGAFVYVGPFKIDAATNSYTVDISFKDEHGTEVTDISYMLTTTNDGHGAVLAPTKEGLNGKEFYVRVRATSAARSVTVKAVPKMLLSSAQGYVWTDGVAGDQPLLTVVRTEETPNPSKKTINFTINQRVRLYDAALRKYIVGYAKENTGTWAGTWSVVENLPAAESRIPQVSKTLAKEVQYNDYSYVHKKDPFRCQVGQYVLYEIRVYNECDEPIEITEITDHLPPSGLKAPTSGDFFNANREYGWEYSSTNNCLVTNHTTNTILQPIGQSQDSTSVRVWLEVTPEAKGKVVTNIAEITNYRVIRTGAVEQGTEYQDKDSGVSTTDEDHKRADLPRSEPEWQAYQGYNNPVPIETSNYWFKGQEDDDDFEKIIVPDEEPIDLALRKSIYEVSGSQKSREVKPDSTPLKNNTDTTSIFGDDKSVLTVQPGDKIKYRIRVFNEGSQDAYASKIEDYLPAGLGYLPQHTLNIENGWSVVSGSGNIRLSDIENAVGNFNKNEFSTEVSNLGDATVIQGKATIRTEKLANEKLLNFKDNDQDLDIHSVEVVCVVLDTLETNTVIKNIAAITEYKNKDKQVTPNDRDSDANTVNPDTYPDNNHIQDDDDYEPIKIVKEPKSYDLALKKFITKVTSENGTVKTLPESQRRYCEVTNTDALKNRTGMERATAQYSLNKTAVLIENKDTVLYTIRLFNEGREDAKVTEIVDTVPPGLSFIQDSQLNRENGWSAFVEESNPGWKTGIRTKKLEGTVIPAFDNSQANGDHKEKGLSYRDIQVELKVDLDTVDENTLESIYNNGIKNIAEITDDDGDDNDSTPNDKNENEDDQDFDIIIPPNPTRFDLALKKFIISINDGETVPNRFRSLNSDLLAEGGQDATYDLDKTVIKVKSGKKVVYKIRVFNEGSIDGYVKELRDDLPEGLRFVPIEDSQINRENGWQERDRTNLDNKTKR